VDRCPRAEIATARIERQLAWQLTVVTDDADIRLGDQQTDGLALVRTADVDVAELALIAQGDVAAAIHPCRGARGTGSSSGRDGP